MARTRTSGRRGIQNDVRHNTSNGTQRCGHQRPVTVEISLGDFAPESGSVPGPDAQRVEQHEVEDEHVFDAEKRLHIALVRKDGRVSILSSEEVLNTMLCDRSKRTGHQGRRLESLALSSVQIQTGDPNPAGFDIAL
jgi:hypothetical protein